MSTFERWCRAVVLGGLCIATDAMAWGDEGHRIVGEIALRHLQPAVRQRVFALLASDTDPLTAHDLASETTWADRFRDSDRGSTKVHYLATRQWHFVDIELTGPDIDAACFHHPPIGPGLPASQGPAADCSVDKVDQFVAELASPTTAPAERLVALKFLLHFVGDLHQPLHASDALDAGGNGKTVSAAGLGSGTLHGFWDTQFVRRLGVDPVAVGGALAAKITASQAAAWSSGTPTDWALESFAIARTTVYGTLPKPTNGVYALPARYVAASAPIVGTQLSRAGVRLAAVLNRALAVQTSVPTARR